MMKKKKGISLVFEILKYVGDVCIDSCLRVCIDRF